MRHFLLLGGLIVPTLFNMGKSSKKDPADYPIFLFRCDKPTKNRLNKTVESVRKSLNYKKPDKQKLYRKNDVIVEALLLGLPLLKARGAKK